MDEEAKTLPGGPLAPRPTPAGAAQSRSRRRFSVVVGVLALLLCGRASAQSDPETHDAHDMMKWETTGFVLSEVLEYAPLGTDRPVRYDLIGWVGGAWNRVWAKADGAQSTTVGQGATEVQVLYGRLISPYWDAQVGVRVDALYGGDSERTRAALALGVQGLAPGWFEVEPTVFVSHRGDVSASLTASYDLLLTQRLIAQPRLETGVAVQDVPEFGVGSGLTDLDLALRVRYELWREFAPYAGIAWTRTFGETADLARAADEPVSDASVVLGLRLWW